jgi:hypothetical protein
VRGAAGNRCPYRDIAPRWPELVVFPRAASAHAERTGAESRRWASRFGLVIGDPLDVTISWPLTGAAGQINGTTRASHNVDRVGVATGVYALGAPRQIEFGLRLNF